MISYLSSTRSWSLGLLAILVVGATIASSFGAPTPNLTDLQGFRGRTSGTAKVAVGTSPFLGKSKIVVSIPGATAAKMKITASVKSGGNSVPVNNELTFASSGAFRGKELAPGITSGVPFKGSYTATTDMITFQGKFKAGTATGTFSGTAKKSSSGKLKITYSIFVGTATDANYVYTYVGK